MKPKILWVLRLLLGGLFIVSGFTKLIEPYQNFLAVILSYELITGTVAKAAAIVLPWMELILGAFVLVGLWNRFSVALLWVLNSTFLVAILQALIRRLPVKDCGCFGESFLSLSLHQALAIDMGVWLVLAVLFLKSDWQRFR